MEPLATFVDVLLPIPLAKYFTYRVPQKLISQIHLGKRVIVQFRGNKLYTALIKKIHHQAPVNYTAKYIDDVVDESPIVNEFQGKLWSWIAEYYMCSEGDVMNAALPAGLKLSSETKVVLNEELFSDEIRKKEIVEFLSDDEFIIYEALEINSILTINEIYQLLSNRPVHAILRRLTDKNIVLLFEEIKERYKPKLEWYVELTEYAKNEANQRAIFETLEKKAFKQLEILMTYLKLSKIDSDEKYKIIKKTDLLKAANTNQVALDKLVEKNVFKLFQQEVSRFVDTGNEKVDKLLSTEQQQAFDSLKEQFKSKDVALLHGVTASGKTEVYFKLIEEQIAKGKQVLYLLPEIALTMQLINRLRKKFGDRVGVYHSKYSDNERVEVWRSLVTENSPKQFDVIIGARSSLFLPFSKLGLIIVDEEHDHSYKQYDPAPRYHARDTSIYLAKLHNAKVLLGSATPSLESYYNSQQHKYGYAALLKRFTDVKLPEILIVDIKEESRKKKMKSLFSDELLNEITNSLSKKEQVILFQNRRGFVPIIECTDCGWVPQCKQCDVSLTYHKYKNELKCHYCGYTTQPPAKCEACGNTKLLMLGFGTEKIVEELQHFLPDAKIDRMDLDTTRSKFSYQKIIQDFEDGGVDILVGTQMVTKGLDFDNVALVGIPNADSLFNFPNFRSYERAYQMIAQVAGRAGRKNKQGKVIIQSYYPTHPVLSYLINDEVNKF
ncbi:MAG: primosomal protein N', partial [Bacteroidetes bacterium]|nr:primosomal protein N' [Bacteroidota bacterium]